MSIEIKELVKKILYGPLSPIASAAFALIASLEYRHYNNKWKKQGRRKPEQDEIR